MVCVFGRGGGDLAQIWRYPRENVGEAVADRVEAVVLEKVGYLAKNPGAGIGGRI